MCRLSWNLGASTTWKPQGLSRPVMGLLYLFTNKGYYTHNIGLLLLWHAFSELQIGCDVHVLEDCQQWLQAVVLCYVTWHTSKGIQIPLAPIQQHGTVDTCNSMAMCTVISSTFTDSGDGIDWYSSSYLYARSQNWEKRLLALSCLSVCLSVCVSVRMEQLGSEWTDFHEIWYFRIFFSENLSRK